MLSEYDSSTVRDSVCSDYAKLCHAIERAVTRPSVIFRATLTDVSCGTGGRWQAAHGDLFAVAETPEKAMAAFDDKWRRQA